MFKMYATSSVLQEVGSAKVPALVLSKNVITLKCLVALYN